jgi:hypothetical protein
MSEHEHAASVAVPQAFLQSMAEMDRQLWQSQVELIAATAKAMSETFLPMPTKEKKPR